MNVHLDSRLKAVAEEVRPEVRVADVGTDHGLIPCLLSLSKEKRPKKIYASDIAEKPLDRARRSAALYGCDDIEFILCDGLSKIPPCDDIIIAGMGGENIAKIVKSCPFLSNYPRFILQPMTRAFVLRRELYGSGFEIEREKAAYAAGKIYTVMICRYTGKKKKISDEFAFFGKNTDEAYVSKQLETLKKMGKGSEKFLLLAQKKERELTSKGPPAAQNYQKNEKRRQKMALSAANGKRIITVRDVYECINSFAPFASQDSFDNSGLLVGDMNAVVSKGQICLDITNKVVEEAAAKGADLIISHHPVIFHKLDRLDTKDPVFSLAKNGINALCVHTPLDMAKGGISDIMLDLLDFGGQTRVLDPIHKDGTGYGRIVELDFAADGKALASIAKKAFNCTVVRYYDSGRNIKTVGVCSGAGGSEKDVINACRRGCDALITGDVKHSGFIEAMNRGLTLIDAGHFHTENIVCGWLAAKLEEMLKTEFSVAESSVDNVKYLF